MGQRWAWRYRVMLACLWRDLKVVRHRTWRVKEDSREYTRYDTREGERVLSLPRSVRQVEWGDEQAHSWASSHSQRAHWVRAHYRQLAEGWQTSQAALDNARNEGFPDPPAGYTFVSMYAKGDTQANAAVPRVVCKGFQIAHTVLDR